MDEVESLMEGTGAEAGSGDGTGAGEGAGAGAGEEEHVAAAGEGEEAAAAGEGEGAGAGEGAGEGSEDESTGLTEEEEALELESFDGDKTKLRQTMAQSLNDLYGRHPALKDFLKENPELRPIFFKAKEMEKDAPTLAHFREMKQGADDMRRLDDLYYAGTEEGAFALLEQLQKADMVDGQPQGNFRILRNVAVADHLAETLEMAEKQPGQLHGVDPKQVRLAALILGKAAGLKGYDVELKRSLEDKGGTETPEQKEIRLEREKIARDREKLNTEHKQAEAGRVQAFRKGIQRDFLTWVNAESVKVLEKATALKGDDKAGMRELVGEIVSTRVRARMNSDAQFISTLERLEKTGNRSLEARTKILNNLKLRARQEFAKATGDVLKKLGHDVMQSQAGADKRREEGASRREAAGTGGPGKNNRPSGEPKPLTRGMSDEAYLQEVLDSQK